MLCGAYVLRGWKTKKAQTKSSLRPTILAASLDKGVIDWNKQTRPNIVVESEYICSGRIIASIDATTEFMVYPVLEIKYKCDHCGNTFYPNLPNEYNISEAFTRMIEEI